MDEFQDLPIQFGQVLKAKNVNACDSLLVGLGGPTRSKQILKEFCERRIGRLSLSLNDRITQDSFRAGRRQLEKH